MRFDEPHAYKENKWLFDKSVWQRLFRLMNACGFNAMFFANTHPFPFMIEYDQYCDAAMLKPEELQQYQRMYKWIFTLACEYDIKPYLLFFSIYYPDAFAEKRGLSGPQLTEPSQLALDYTSYCVSKALETYPELSGIVCEASETFNGDRAAFLEEAIIKPAKLAKTNADIIVRGWKADPKEIVTRFDEAGLNLKYSVKYTWEHLVSEKPDPMFKMWAAAAGPERILGEFWISNFEPLTSFSFRLAEDILQSLGRMGCAGFSLQPLSLYEWPFTSDRDFRFQWQRDLIWYQIWGGASLAELVQEGTPKWLHRHADLLSGFQAGAKILETTALYFGGDKQNQWHPQFATIQVDGECRLLSVADLADFTSNEHFWAKTWQKEITGINVMHLPDALKNPDPDAFGPFEFIARLTEYVNEADETLRKTWSRIRNETELPCLAKNLEAQSRLGSFWIERMRAAIAHARNDDANALKHMQAAMEEMQNVASIEKRHRDGFRFIVGRDVVVGNWDGILAALNAELQDAKKGEWKPGSAYIAHRTSCSCNKAV